MAECIAEGRGGPDDQTFTGELIRRFVRPAGGRPWVAEYLECERRFETRPQEHFVPVTVRWWSEGETFLGRISVRHRLNEHLLETGGHIGYGIRPGARRRGHATAMLAAALPLAARLGIEKALITCDFDNVGSRKVIERNGGVLEDCRGGKLRFWVPTGPSAETGPGEGRPARGGL